MTRYRYGLGRIELESEFELSLTPSTSGLSSTATIRQGAAGTLSNPVAKTLLMQIAPQDCLLDIPGLARYRVRGGLEIVVEAGQGACRADVVTYLLTYALAALCSQRGLLVLHATALDIAGQGVLLTGPSGSGKSTLGAALALRGAVVLSDDLCVIDAGGEVPLLLPCSNHLVLWADCMEQLGYGTAPRQRPVESLQKFSIELTALSSAPVPVRHVLALCETRLPQPRGLVAMRLLEAVATCSSAAYVPALVEGMNRRQAHLDQCLRVASAARVLKLFSSWGFAELPRTAQAIEQLVRASDASQPLAGMRGPG